jgi:uncharacterized protein YndB with AHSA1/START domain
MATSIVSADRDTIVTEIDIAAPADRVFRGICDPETVRRRAPYIEVFEMDLRVGGKWYMQVRMPQPHRGFSTVIHDGEVLEVDPPRLIAYSWHANFHEDPKHRSVVRWELTPTKSGTHVKVTHSGLASEPGACKDYAQGWPGVLQELKVFAEKQ